MPGTVKPKWVALFKPKYPLKAINDKKLYEIIVRHRYTHNRIGEFNYNLHQPQTINPVPIPEFIDAWEADYKTMQEQMIYGDSSSFNDMINAIKNFTVNKINKLDWQMEVEFQKPVIQTNAPELRSKFFGTLLFSQA